MERNIQQNKEVVGDRTRAMELDWKAISNGNLDVAKHPCLGPDYILISDCIYYKGILSFIYRRVVIKRFYGNISISRRYSVKRHIECIVPAILFH